MRTSYGDRVSRFTGLCDRCAQSLAIAVTLRVDGELRADLLTPEWLGEQVTELRGRCLDECGRAEEA